LSHRSPFVDLSWVLVGRETIFNCKHSLLILLLEILILHEEMKCDVARVGHYCKSLTKTPK
jgi:hypothetical protein